MTTDVNTRRYGLIAAAATLVLVVVIALVVTLGNRADAAGGGTSPADPIWVTSPSAVPATAVQTGQTTNECATTTTWSNTAPGATEQSHQEYRFKRVVPAQSEVKEYTFDKYVQKQKARWKKVNGTWVYDNAISYGYGSSFTWRDAGFAPVTNTTGVVPTAPGPVKDAYIHSNGGEWYYTYFYEYRKIGERVIQAAQPAYTEYYVAGRAPSRNVADATWEKTSTLTGWTRFEERKVVDVAGVAPVVTYYAYNDGKVCATIPPPPPPTTTPPVSTPPPAPKVKPSVHVSTRCTGTTRYVLNNTKSETSVPFKLKGGKWSNKVNVPAGQKVVVVKRLQNGVRAVVSTVGDRDAVTVPNPCPKPPRQTPHTGQRN